MGRSLATVLVLLSLVLLVSSCATLPMTLGKGVDVSALEKDLQIGRSTSSDIALALGEPIGTGKEQLFTGGPVPRTVWSYYYEQGNDNYSRMKKLFLFVFLNGDRYDGYLWFSSMN
jgi:hypothetical protein